MPLGLQHRLRSVSGDSEAKVRATLSHASNERSVREWSLDGREGCQALGLDIDPMCSSPMTSATSKNSRAGNDRSAPTVHEYEPMLVMGLTPSGESNMAIEEAADRTVDPEEEHFKDSIYDLTIQYFCQIAERGADTAGLLNLISVLVLQAVNLTMQLFILKQVHTLIAQPAEVYAQQLYATFTEVCYAVEPGADPAALLYSHEVAERFNDWDEEVLKTQLCQFPLASPQFFVMILLVWTFFLAHELKDTLALAYHMSLLERPRQGERVVVEDCGENRMITHLNLPLKLAIMGLVLLPKLFIASFLWLIGAGWLTSTMGIDNVLLNALALTFICDLDELIFATCVSSEAKVTLSRTTLLLPPKPEEKPVWNISESMGTLFCCVIVSSIYMYKLQDAIPDYRGDLEAVCENHNHLAVAMRGAR